MEGFPFREVERMSTGQQPCLHYVFISSWLLICFLLRLQLFGTYSDILITVMILFKRSALDPATRNTSSSISSGVGWKAQCLNFM